MSDLTNLKLIKAVDPTKIKVTINEKFSKLTLSSNKKKNNESTKPPDPIEVEKRQSASRNLMEELVDNADIVNDNLDNAKYSNAILRSSSSMASLLDYKHDVELTETLTQMDNTRNESKGTQSSMSRLQMSDEHELDDLTQKVSNLTVDQGVGVLKLETMSFAETEIIDLDSDDSKKTDSEDEESIICVSDSDDENLPPGPEDEYNLMITSDIVNNGQNNEAELPCTLSNERADRIEAFLRDVSQEQRNIALTGGRLAEDSFLVHLPTPTEQDENALKRTFKAKQMATADTESIKTNTESMHQSTDLRKQRNEIINDERTSETIIKAKQMATADTESLNTDSDSMRQFVVAGKQNELAFDDTEPINESTDVSLLLKQYKNLSGKVSVQSSDSKELSARRFANDDTEANTSVDSTSNNIEESDQSVSNVLPEESIVISETSCEDSKTGNDGSDKELPTLGDDGLVPSEEVLSEPQNDCGNTSTGIGTSSINISAKINIKVKFRANISFSDQNNLSDSSVAASQQNSSVSSSSSSKSGNAEDVSDVDDNEKENEICSKASSELIGQEKQALKPIKNSEPCTPKPDNGSKALSYAEKLLNELYGQAWQTPDILKSLKISNKSENVKNNETKLANDTGCQNDANTKSNPRKPSKNINESQFLDDFSTFRNNIEKTNMDSTRLVTPKPKSTRKKLAPQEVRTEPRQEKNKSGNNRTPLKAPQTEFKKKPSKPVNERWRQLVDEDSGPEDNDASDDDHIEQTLITDDESEDEDKASNASDSSWQALTEDADAEDDSEAEEVVAGRNKTKMRTQTKSKSQTKIKTKSQKNQLIYMDLSKDEVSIVQQAGSPPANHDENFQKRLSDLLDSCRHEERPKLEATPRSIGKSKRRLFTPNYGYEEINADNVNGVEKALKEISLNNDDRDEVEDLKNVNFNGVLIPPSFNIFNKRLESVKTGKPVYKITPPRLKEPKMTIATREETTPFKTPHILTTPKAKDKHKLNEISSTPGFKYSFLKSLDVCVGKSLCHPDALAFRENYRQKKEDLAKILYELYNSKLFKNDLNVPIQWNKKLLNTAGRCLNKKKAGQRFSVVELSDKVLTSADRLRCTLIHELCHAATWVFNGEGGHGATWKEWARKANMTFPELPKIGVCHQYDIEYKYTYKCTLCAAKSYYHSKSKKVENIRCSYCYGAIEIFLNKKDKEGNVMPTPVKEPTGFAKFVKEKYKQYKRPDMKHAEIMKLLSNEYAALKVTDKGK